MTLDLVTKNNGGALKIPQISVSCQVDVWPYGTSHLPLTSELSKQAGQEEDKKSRHYTAKPNLRELRLSWKYNSLKQIKYRALLIQPNFKTQGLPTKPLRNTLMQDFHSPLV